MRTKEKPKTKKLARGKPLATITDKATERLIEAEDKSLEMAEDDADVMGYCKEWWAKYGESVPVAYSSMMRRLPNRLRLRSRLLDSLARLTASGSLYFKHSYLSKNMIYHPNHIPVFGDGDQSYIADPANKPNKVWSSTVLDPDNFDSAESLGEAMKSVIEDYGTKK